MNRFIVILFGLVISSLLIFPQATWAVSAGLGVKDGFLSVCPDTPNCVVSQGLLRQKPSQNLGLEPALSGSQNNDLAAGETLRDRSHSIAPIVYHRDLNTARETLLKVLTVVPRTEIIEQTDNYIRAESKSRIFKFIDDVEFYFPEDRKVIEMRSASRVGESDLGVNRRRLEQIRLAMSDLDI